MGVKVFPRTRVTSVAESGEKSGLLVSATQSPPPAADGKEKGPAMAVSIPANEIIVTDTVSANSSISGLPESCFDVNNGGFLVDSTLCMPDAKNVYAAGDVASYPQDGVHGRLEHHVYPRANFYLSIGQCGTPGSDRRSEYDGKGRPARVHVPACLLERGMLEKLRLIIVRLGQI